MNIFKFRYIKPIQSEWIEEKGSSVEDAIQNHHIKDNNDKLFGVRIMVKNAGIIEHQSFALVECETGEKLISRICSTGIFRKGGVKDNNDLSFVASKLDVSLDSLMPPWSEETYEDAKMRLHSGQK